ncbi:YdbH domain-containing protein [Brevundimonas sp.]|uniref:intermembrane phospholipid transport protein YdbH family protein n=1 Tax=Brevundimonas sp. TaxID=1871086 RepID=UPI002FC66019
MPAAQKAKRQSKRLPLGCVGTGLTVGALVVLLGAGALYMGRRAVAEEVLVGWLHRRGIAADVQVERIEWDGFTGRIIVGNPDDPDVRIDRVEVDYLIGLPWMQDGLGLTPKRVLLSRPLIKAEWTGEKLSFGALDPLIEEFTAKPQGAKKPGPVIVVDKGQVLLATPYGQITALADARINDMRLEWLKASLNPAALTLDDMKATGLQARIEARSTGDALSFSGQASAEALATADLAGSGASLTLNGQVPYPRKDVVQANGPVTLQGQVEMALLDGEGVKARDFTARLDWGGQLTGWIDRFVLKGRGSMQATAQAVETGEQRLSNVRMVANDVATNFSRGQKDQTPATGEGQQNADFKWQLEGPLQLAAARLQSGDNRLNNVQLVSSRLKAGGEGGQMEVQAPLTLLASEAVTGDLQMRQVRGQFVLDGQRGLVTRIALSGSLAANGRFNGLGPVKADDAVQIERLKLAANDFALSAPALSLVQNNRGLGVQLDAPVQLKARNGVEVRLAALGGPVLRMAGGAPTGAMKLSVTGEDIPNLNVDVTSWQAASGGLTAQLRANGQTDFDPLRGVALQTAGTLSLRNGITTYQASDCASLQARQVQIGENNLDALSARLCADGRPLFTAQQGRWELAGRLADTQLQASFLELDLENGAGRLRVSGQKNDLSMRLSDIVATVKDSPDIAEARINPLGVGGEVSLSRGVWNGALNLSREDVRLATVNLVHANATHEGRLDLHAGPLTFAADGLQPAAISPLLKDYMVNASGDAIGMKGEVLWSAKSVTSQGQITIGNGQADDTQSAGLSFDTPMGRLVGLRGTVQVTDLLKLETASDQMLSADRLDSVMPITDLKLTMGLGEGALNISQASLKLDAGGVSVRDVVVPLNGVDPVHGLIQVDNLQVNDLLIAASLGEKAKLDARLNGQIRFDYQRQRGWQFHSVDLRAQGGHLSVQPEVLTGMSAEGGDVHTATGPDIEIPPNAVQGFAYQALENLAINDLSADVYTLPEGRLAVNFRIQGYHAPPQKQELRISIMDLFNGKLMERKLPLPSGAPVILNLRTDWNANELATDIYHLMQRRFADLSVVGADEGGEQK